MCSQTYFFPNMGFYTQHLVRKAEGLKGREGLEGMRGRADRLHADLHARSRAEQGRPQPPMPHPNPPLAALQDDAHVFIPEEFWDKMPTFEEKSPEADAIKRMFRDIVQDYSKETSYFASYIKLTPDMNGMNVGIGPIKPWILHPDRSFDGVHDSPISKFQHRTNEIFG
jgi:hypothetical protein